MFLADFMDSVGRDFALLLALVAFLIWKARRKFGDEKVKEGAKVGINLIRSFWNKY